MEPPALADDPIKPPPGFLPNPLEASGRPMAPPAGGPPAAPSPIVPQKSANEQSSTAAPSA